MDLKIELRNLLALHESCARLEHGIRDARSQHAVWREFSPSRFVYAFFTFNSIYSFDWSSSFLTKKAVLWIPDERRRLPSEEDQIKSYVRAINERLTPNTATLFREVFMHLLSEFGLQDPVSVLRDVPLTNATKALKGLVSQLAPYTEKLMKGTIAPDDMYPTLSHLLQFIYRVRCNIFHGAKTHVQMAKVDQQQRLLVYCAIVVATNALLFEVAKCADIGWQEVDVNFSR